MKMVLALVLSVLVLSGASAQTAPENRWIIGTWTDPLFILTMVFNDDGTGAMFVYDGTGALYDVERFIFSVFGNRLTVFETEGGLILYHHTVTVHRVSDRVMVWEDGGVPMIFNRTD